MRRPGARIRNRDACRLFAAGFGLVAALATAHGEESERAEAFAAEAAKRIGEEASVRGDEPGWFFLVRELQHLATGNFWEKPWVETAKNGTDPVPEMVRFAGLLEEKGIGLLVVPVPPKAAVYPEKLDHDFEAGEAPSLSPFVKLLREHGLRVLDLEKDFLALRESDPGRLLYCRQDAHYSPSAIERIADLALGELGIEASPSPGIMRGEAEDLVITGDQVAGSKREGKVAPERISVSLVRENGEEGIEPDPSSPLLLLGDSHTLVFHEGKETGMHCRGGGLADHLSFRLGKPVDLVGVRGSGMMQARKQLFYHAAEHAGYWESKKWVVWVFSAREFTQSRDRIQPIPIER